MIRKQYTLIGGSGDGKNVIVDWELPAYYFPKHSQLRAPLMSGSEIIKLLKMLDEDYELHLSHKTQENNYEEYVSVKLKNGRRVLMYKPMYERLVRDGS